MHGESRKAKKKKNLHKGFINFAEIGGYAICIIGLGEGGPCVPLFNKAYLFRIDLSHVAFHILVSKFA